MNQHPTQSDRREYFRVTGTVYLNIKPHKDQDQPQPNETPTIMDSVGMKIMHLKNRLSYHQKEIDETTSQIIEVMQEIHQNLQSQNKPQDNLVRQSVIISGGAIEFLSETAFELDSLVTITLAFPDYPFTTVTTQGKVISVSSFGQELVRYRTVIEFIDIPDEKRDSVIQFVNHLQRKQIQQ